MPRGRPISQPIDVLELPPEMVDAAIAPPEEYIFRDEGENRRVVADPVESEDQVTELTDEERLWFSSLLTCGRRYKTLTVMGEHQVVVQTLCSDDDLRIGLFTKEFRDSDAFPRAFQIATCAAGIRAVDGRPLYQSLEENPDEDAMFAEKVERLKKYYPVVITEIYRAIMDLDKEFVDLATKLGKLKG